MNKLKTASKRVKPILGTFIEITLFGFEPTDSIYNLAFTEAVKLEKIFNFHDPYSELSMFNLKTTNSISAELKFVLNFANELAEFSHFTFQHLEPPLHETKVNLNGVAKGYIVDSMVNVLLNQHKDISGIINAGGDLKIFNSVNKRVQLRLGSADKPKMRELIACQDAVASSSVSVSKKIKTSSTQYFKNVRSGLNNDSTVVVQADSCLIADALTKVGLFGDVEVIKKCADKYKAHFMAFDANGNLTESYGQHEN